MKYLVTGGAGFIGSNIVSELLKQDQDVVVLDNFATGKRENILPLMKNPRMTMIEGDLRSFHIVRSAVKGVDYILHQGALPSVPRSINDPITSNDVNILGMLNILEAAKEFGVKRVVCASSSSIYGNSETLPKVESMPINPMSPYALTKYAQERYCQVFYQLYGLETVALRYFNVFGPRQDPTSQYSAVIPKFIKMIMNDQEPVIYGDGSQSRDYHPCTRPYLRHKQKREHHDRHVNHKQRVLSYLILHWNTDLTDLTDLFRIHMFCLIEVFTDNASNIGLNIICVEIHQKPKT